MTTTFSYTLPHNQSPKLNQQRRVYPPPFNVQREDSHTLYTDKKVTIKIKPSDIKEIRIASIDQSFKESLGKDLAYLFITTLTVHNECNHQLNSELWKLPRSGPDNYPNGIKLGLFMADSEDELFKKIQWKANNEWEKNDIFVQIMSKAMSPGGPIYKIMVVTAVSSQSEEPLFIIGNKFILIPK